MTKLFLLVGIFVSLGAQAGVINGGGGKGVLCTQPDGQRTLESLDRYEARVIWRYSVPASKDFDAEFLRVMARLDSIWAGDARTAPPPYSQKQHDGYLFQYRKFIANLNFLPAGSRLLYTPDSGEVVTPPANCSLVQVITYVDEGAETGQVLVDQEYWNMLGVQDQVAFFLHEFIYKALRVFGERNSARVRKMTGRLVSSEIYTGILEPVRNSAQLLECYNDFPQAPGEQFALHFFLIPGRDERGTAGTTFVFDTIGERGMLATTTAFTYLTFDVWEGKTNVTGSDHLNIGSFLGYERAQLSLGDQTGKISVPPPGQTTDPKWSLTLSDDRQLHTVPFHCHAYTRGSQP